MKKKILFLTVFTAIVLMGSCEKDDICVDGDTPLLVVRFYDVADTATIKAVPSLRVYGVGKNITLPGDRTDNDSIGLPLKTTENSTSFVLINNSADDETTEAETGNADTLTFNYSVNEFFASRACGFVANYHQLTASLQADGNNWIQGIKIVDTVINNQAAAHVKIYH